MAGFRRPLEKRYHFLPSRFPFFSFTNNSAVYLSYSSNKNYFFWFPGIKVFTTLFAYISRYRLLEAASIIPGSGNQAGLPKVITIYLKLLHNQCRLKSRVFTLSFSVIISLINKAGNKTFVKSKPVSRKRYQRVGS